LATATGAEPDSRGGGWRGWLARLSFALAAGAIAVLVIFAGLKSLALFGVALLAAAIVLTAAYFFLSRRGLRRWCALAVAVVTPVAVIAGLAFVGLLWVACASAAAWLLAGVTARAALSGSRADWRMPEHVPKPVAHPFLIMNPRSGGGKVGKFDLQRKAEALGAKVYLMSGPGPVDVAAVAERAVASGADLLGAAGGDGTQALVAGVAAKYDLPFMVISAGTRNHFALDLGLDRDDPSTCLDALTDGVELRVDLGTIGRRTFVNNASFGAYAEVVETPAYRGDKVGTTLDLLPDLLQGHRGARLTAHVGTEVVSTPEALLVANNPYGDGDIAGLSRRMRLDRGVLGVIAVKVDNARQALGLIRGTRAAGLNVLATDKIVVTADSGDIPVGVDGEAVRMPTPVSCTIRPGALRVLVPRRRPGVAPPRPPIEWARLWRLAIPLAWRKRAARQHAGDPSVATEARGSR
jgi:diacylglycerol kinase family enzyme